MDEMMRFRTALSSFARLAQVEDGELARFAKTRLGDDVPVSVDDLRVARDLVRAVGQALARNDAATWTKLREARELALGAAPAATPAEAAKPPPPAAPSPGYAPGGAPPALPSHMLTPAPPSGFAPPAAPNTASPWAPGGASLGFAPGGGPAPTAPAQEYVDPRVRVAPDELVRTKGMQFVLPIKPLPFAEADPKRTAEVLAAPPQRPKAPPAEEDHLGMTMPADSPSSARPLPFAGAPAGGAPRPSAESFGSAGGAPSAVVAPGPGPASARGAPPSQPRDEPPLSSGPAPQIPRGQRFTLAQYASLRVDLESSPERSAAVLQTYGIAGADELAGIDAIWKQTFAEQPALTTRFAELRGEYVRYLASRRGRS